MSYEISITETRTVRKVGGKIWAKIGTKEQARDPQFIVGPESPKTILTDVMGYTPEVEVTASEERLLLKQTVDSIDLGRVIKAINNL